MTRPFLSFFYLCFSFSLSFLRDRNFKLLSFGEEAEEDDDEVTEISKVYCFMLCLFAKHILINGMPFLGFFCKK